MIRSGDILSILKPSSEFSWIASFPGHLVNKLDNLVKAISLRHPPASLLIKENTHWHNWSPLPACLLRWHAPAPPPPQSSPLASSPPRRSGWEVRPGLQLRRHWGQQQGWEVDWWAAGAQPLQLINAPESSDDHNVELRSNDNGTFDASLHFWVTTKFVQVVKKYWYACNSCYILCHII